MATVLAMVVATVLAMVGVPPLVGRLSYRGSNIMGSGSLPNLPAAIPRLSFLFRIFFGAIGLEKKGFEIRLSPEIKNLYSF